MKWPYILSICISILLYYFLYKSDYSRDYTIFQDKRPAKLTIHSYGSGGMYYKIADTLAKYLGKDDKPITVVNPTEGSLENLKLVNSEKFSIGLCQLDVLLEHNKKNDFKKIRIIDTIYMEYLHLLVKDDYPKISCANLLGMDSLFKSFNSGKDMSGSKTTVNNFIDFINEYCNPLPQIDKASFSNNSTDDSIDYLKGNENECTAFVTGYPSGVIKKQISQFEFNKFKLLGIDTNLIHAFTKQNEGYVYKMLPAYNSNHQPIPTFATFALLIANENLPQDIAQASIDFLNKIEDPNYENLFRDQDSKFNNVSDFKKNNPVDIWKKVMILLSTFLLPLLFTLLIAESYKKVNSLKEEIAKLRDQTGSKELKVIAADNKKLSLENEKYKKSIAEHETKLADNINSSDFNELSKENQELKNIITDLKTKLPSKLEIGIVDNGKYFFRLDFPSLGIEGLEYKTGDLEPIYKDLLSFAICKRLQKRHVLPSNPNKDGAGYNYTNYKKELTKRVNKHLKEKNIETLFNIKSTELLVKLNNSWGLNIKRDNITILEKYKIKGDEPLLEYLEDRIEGGEIDFN